MAHKMIKYKQKKISVVDIHGKKHLFIEGEHIPLSPTNKAGRHRSLHLPYQEFSSLHELGKAIVDYRAMDKKKG